MLTNIDATNVLYGLLRVHETVDMCQTVKFVYLHFVGEQVPMVKKGRFGIVKGTITDKFFSPHHVAFHDIASPDEITEEMVMKAVAVASGTAKHELASTEGRQIRGFTSKPTHQESPHLNRGSQTKTPQYKDVKAVDTKAHDLQFDSALTDAIAQVRSDSNDVDWVLGTYEDGDTKKPIQLLASGSGGLAALTQHLDNGLIMYGLLRCADVFDGVHTVKFVYVAWLGEDVPHMARARVTVHKGAASEYFAPHHVAFDVTNRNELAEDIVMSKVQSASGSKNNVL